MAKRALLVGCNYPGTKCELHGCANDVKRMRTTLVERFGFDESDILVMLDTDPSTPQPTGANIRSSLKKLINSVEPGDVLVFHYSGHGTQVPPESGAPGESDTEEAIVPTDMNLLTDDDVRELVNQIPAGVAFTFLSDSCHSGGMIDNEKEQIGGGGSTTVGGGGGYAAAAPGGGVSGGGGGGGVGGALMGLISQGLQKYTGGDRGGQSQTRDFHFPSSGERIQQEEDEGALYGERGHRQPPRSYQQEEGYGEEERYEGSEGRRKHQVNDVYEGEGRGGYVAEGYGDRRHVEEQFYEGRRGHGGEEGYGGRRARRHQDNEDYDGEGQRVYGGEEEEGYGGRRGRRGGGGSEYYEAEGGGGRGYGAGEEGYRGEEYQNFNHGKRNERSEEEGGHGGYGRTEAVPDYHHQSQQGGYGVVAQPPRQISKNIPVDLLTQILSQRTGQNVQVGNIRTTIFDMFGDQASPSVKMFVNLALSQLQQQGGGQGGWLGTVSSLASQFLQTKLDDQSPEDATNYVAPAEQAGIPGPKTRVASDVSILVSGCQTDETSADANPTHSPANSYGAFSNAIQTVLTQNPSPMTNRDLVLAVRKVLAQQGFKQHPCLYCSDEKVDAPFICE